MKLSDRTAISMPMRNLIGIITAVSVGVVVENVKEVVNETFILEKPITFESEKRVLVALPIIKVNISKLLTVDDGFYLVKNFENYRSKEDIEWEIESKGWRDIYYSSKFKLFY